MSGTPTAVLAALTECASAPAEGWCLGLFDDPLDSFAHGQQAALDLLCAPLFGPLSDSLSEPLSDSLSVARFIPPAPTPRRVLLAGVAAPALAAQLQAIGHTVRVLSPRDADMGPAVAHSVSEPFDILLCAGLDGQIDPMQLLAAADGLLVPQNAELWLVDEFSVVRTAEGTAGLQNLPTLLSLAERQGWKLAHQGHLPAASATWVHLEILLHQHRSRLADELQVGDESWAYILASLRQRQALHRSGVWAFVHLHLRRPERPADTIARVGPAQGTAMRELFASVFGQPMDESEWHWKYGNERGRAVGLWKDGQMLAHFGALTRPVMLRGRPGLACQLGDVMVSPKANGGLGRQGVFYRLGASLLEVEIGWGLRHEIGFGFPNARHMRVAERVKLYAHADEVAGLAWPAQVSAASQPAADESTWTTESVDLAALREGSLLWAELEALWQGMAAGLPEAVIGLRDPAWLRHRYGRRPHVRYEGLAVRSSLGPGPVLGRSAGPLVGLVVLRLHEGHAELMDLVGPTVLLQGLVRQARRHAFAQGRPRLEAWITRSHRHWLEDAGDPATEHPLGVTVPANCHTPGIGPEQLHGCWFLMSGDTDFR